MNADWLFIYIRSRSHTDSGDVVYYLLKDYQEQGRKRKIMLF
jgi:hypothetical protein